MKQNVKEHTRTFALVACGAVLVYIFYIIAGISVDFAQDTAGVSRPLIPVLGWFWIAFAVYVLSWTAIGGFSKNRFLSVCKINWVDLALIVGFGLVFRILVTPTAPIQEIDIYRYVWDGAVVSNRLDPYQFCPKTVLDAVVQPELKSGRDGLDAYTSLVKQRPGLKKVLDITHFGEYTSPYPPTSQLFFGLAVAAVDKRADAETYVHAMKIMLVGFDLLAGIIVIMLLYHVGMSVSLSLAYWWCPLVIKEIANGGHLDSIATCFAILAVYLTTLALWPRHRKNNEKDSGKISAPDTIDELPRLFLLKSGLSAVALAASIAAKVFPLVLIPLWLAVLFRRSGFSGLVAVAVFVGSTFFFCFPMMKHLEIAHRLNLVDETSVALAKTSDPSGIEAFSQRWEMNDFLFMLIVENLKPGSKSSNAAQAPEIDVTRTPWFRVTSDEFRDEKIRDLRHLFEQNDSENPKSGREIAFAATRLLTIGIFGWIVVWSCAVLLTKPDPRRWLEMAFLTLAWFWLLAPTQNPWYWTWSIPLLAFSRGRTWFFMSGLLFVYYLRFWFEYHFTNIDVINVAKTKYGDLWIFDWLFPFSDTFQYQGTTFYDFYIPWIEFGPWLLILFLAPALRLLMNGRKTGEPGLVE